MKTFYKIGIFFLLVFVAVIFVEAQTINKNDCKSSLKTLSQDEKQNVINEIRHYFRYGTGQPETFYKMFDIWLYFDGCRDFAAKFSSENQKPLETNDIRRKKLRQNLIESLGLSENNSESKAITAQVALLLVNDDAKNLANEAIALDEHNYEAYFVSGITKRFDYPVEALENAEKAISLNPKFAPAYALKAEILLNQATDLKNEEQRAKYEEAITTLDKYLSLTPNLVSGAFWGSQRDALKDFLGLAVKKGENNVTQNSNTTVNRTAIKILTQPKPPYTLAAKNTFTEGTVRLKVLFGADGTIRRVLIAKSLPFGLTQEAIIAARQIKFEPATNSGNPISLIKTVTYTFMIF